MVAWWGQVAARTASRVAIRYLWLGGVALSMVAGVATSADAQAVAPTGAIQPGQTRPIPEAPPPKFNFRIEAPRPSPVPRAVEELSFTIRNIVVTGATVYPAKAFRPFIKPLIGKSVHLSNIIRVADEIEAKYRGDGYVLTRAYVPAQSVSNGVFRIAVVEGYVAAVSVVGGSTSVRSRVEHILAPIITSRPLKLAVIEDALLRANELPGVGVSGLLRPSPNQPGASDLVATVTAPRVTTLLSVDNRGAPLTYAWTGAANFAIRSPFSEGGVILLGLAAAPDPSVRYSVAGKYVYPIGDTGLTLSLSAVDSHGQPANNIVGGNFTSDNQAFGARLSYPLVVTRDTKLSLDGGFTWQTAHISELGGLLTAHDEWRELDLAAIYQQNGFLNGVTNATLDLTQGLDIFGASPPGDLNTSRGLTPPAPNFTKLSGVVRRKQHLYGPWNLVVTGVGQYAFNTVYLGEEINFGGAQVGRGYDPAALAGDAGAGGDFELRYDINTAGLQIDSPHAPLTMAQLYAFYDVAKVWNHVGTVTPDFIDSTGFGGRAEFAHKLELGLEFAFPLVRVPTSDYGKQAMRILFNASIKF